MPPHGGINKSNSSLAKLYPVGSIYLSVNNTNPSTFIGGTWERIKDRFLLAAGDSYAAGSTGGEATHTLSVNEMPWHTHIQSVQAANLGTAKTVIKGTEGKGQYDGTSLVHQDDWLINANALETLPNGNSQPHNNMPPYLAVYMWVRTA